MKTSCLLSAALLAGTIQIQAQDGSTIPSAPPAMTAAVALTNALADPIVWQQFQQAAAQAAAAAYLARSTTNQQSLSAATSNLTAEAAPPVSGQITVEGNGAVGQGGPHTAVFAPDVNTADAVDLTMADGQRLQSHLLGLGYYTTDGQAVLTAGMKDSTGELIPPNQIIYRDAFDGVSADLVYTYTAYSIEQNVIIRKQLPSPARYQLDPAKTRLGVITEFVQSPEPMVAPVSVDLSAFNRAQGIEGPAKMSDELIQFQTVRFAQGRAFSLGDSATVVPVAKSWQRSGSNQRDFLVESTPYSLIDPLLKALPPDTARIAPSKVKSFWAMLLNAPRPALAGKNPASPIQLPQAGVTGKGVVLNYLLVSTPLLDINFGGYDTDKVGLAAIGQTTNDFWNEYRNSGNAGAVSMTTLAWSEGVTSPLASIGMTVSNAPGTWGNNTGDGLYDVYIYPWNSGDVFVTLTNLPANTYDFYLYGHGNTAASNSKFQLSIGGAATGWEQTQDSTFAATSSNWVEGVQYVVFRGVSVAGGQPVTVTCAPGDGGSAVFNGMQLLLPQPYDITNAAGLVTNQQVLVLDRFYDTNLWSFTTNTFQAFDIPVTNGLNVITLHADDLAGNVMTTNFSYTLDYSSKTNPPAIQLYWPQNEAQISGDSFTWRGWVSDFTASITAQMVDGGGNTNILDAVVERDGHFWAENLPLSSGASTLTLTVTDAAGNVAMTNITVSQSTVQLTINPPDSGQFLNVA